MPDIDPSQILRSHAEGIARRREEEDRLQEIQARREDIDGAFAGLNNLLPNATNETATPEELYDYCTERFLALGSHLRDRGYAALVNEYVPKTNAESYLLLIVQAACRETREEVTELISRAYACRDQNGSLLGSAVLSKLGLRDWLKERISPAPLPPSLTPAPPMRWDERSRTFTCGAYRKQYHIRAIRQTAILAAFERACWQQVIECPAEEKAHIDRTIESLNATLRDAPIRFGRTDKGKRLVWRMESP